ncbi:hypothetical protein NQ109_31010 [Priestia megaterium]|uniref:hypothetical protein n=1 Tax=Priestia megaterium TaxID=1404 RepID=UPI00215AE701|nr:hypothetical protein [Priestia megaterium]MCR8867331.1 hypothetical protein [Priestia megaterium]MCR8867344.1 hypothetical protein [Priestia megaterium]
MKKNIQIFSILTILITGLIGCSAMQTDKEVYKGEKLNIAVVGKIPETNEKESTVNFRKLSIKDIKKIDLKSYDAVIITKPYLSKAANKEYKDTYLNGHIPFFFVESEASVLPFVDNSLTYKQYADRVQDTQSYMVGILSNPDKDGYKVWKYDYPIRNNKVDRENVKSIYSQAFKTIEKLKKEKRS